MNIRTTITLLLITAAVAGGYLLWHARRGPATPAGGTTTPGPAGADAGTLLTQPPLADGDVIARVEYQTESGAGLVFERAGDAPADPAEPPAWTIAEAQRGRATAWMVNELIISVKALRAVSRTPLSAAGAEQELQAAGIRPQPRARVVLKRADGLKFEVQFGRTIMAGQHTYIYLPSRPTELSLSSGDLQELLARPLAAYRDRRLLELDPEQVEALEITEHGSGAPLRCRLVRTGTGWKFESPVAAAADSPRIDEVIHAASRLWVREWLPEIPGDLSALGLDPPRLEVTLALSRDAAAAAPVSFALSDRHALQAEDVVYARRSGDGQIGLVNASALQEFTPQMAAWRDLRLLQFDPALVDTVTITRPDAALRLTREAGGWSFGVTGEQADERAVMDLIKSLAALRAVSFSGELELASAGLTPPAATVTVTPAVQPAAMLQIGAPTDSAGGRLRYVQTGQSGEIAKVRSGDVEILLGDLDVFIDRTILNCNPARIAKLELERRGPAAARPQRLVFERDAQQVWQVTAPAGQQVELAQINQLVAALADLRGEPVAGAAPDTANHPDPPAHSANAEQSAGADDGAGPCRALQDPDVHLRLHLAALPVVRAGGAATEGAAPEAAEPEILELQAVRQGDRAYVRRGGETRCFEVPAAVHDKLMAELLDGGIWNFDPRRVRSFTWTGPEGTLRFQREDGRWTFTPEPDLPLDDKKVLAHLEQIRGLRTPRYAAFDAAGDSDPEFGLDRPAHLLQFELDDGTAQELRISGVQPPDSDRHFYATIAGDNVVFLLAQASIERLAPRLDALEAR